VTILHGNFFIEGDGMNSALLQARARKSIVASTPNPFWIFDFRFLIFDFGLSPYTIERLT
jgi:hypothetical protein